MSLWTRGGGGGLLGRSARSANGPTDPPRQSAHAYSQGTGKAYGMAQRSHLSVDFGIGPSARTATCTTSIRATPPEPCPHYHRYHIGF